MGEGEVDLEAILARGRARTRLPDAAVRRLLRERAGLSQDDVAEACGVTRAAVTRWEAPPSSAGVRRPRGPALERYLALLDRLAAER